MGESYYNQKKSFKLFGSLNKSEFPQIYNFQAILCKIVNCNFFNILRNSMDYMNIIDEIDARKREAKQLETDTRMENMSKSQISESLKQLYVLMQI